MQSEKAWSNMMILSPVFLVGILMGIFFPDIDQMALSFLNHRSIVTHGLLVPLLLMMFRSAFLGVGMVLGVAVHISADVLSPAVGFGAIWLPLPFKISLGYLSYAWNIVNIFFGVYIFKSFVTLLCGKKNSGLIFFVFTIAVSTVYVVLHRENFVTIIVAFMSSALAYKLNIRVIDTFVARSAIRVGSSAHG